MKEVGTWLLSGAITWTLIQLWLIVRNLQGMNRRLDEIKHLLANRQ